MLRRSPREDRRRQALRLSARGRRSAAALDARSARQVESMAAIEGLLGARSRAQEPVRLYALEYGWNEEFEGLVAEVAASFLGGHDPRRERCWIAEQRGERVGSVMLVRGPSDAIAMLRLPLVEPAMRGSGLGSRLVEECIRFARAKGYRRLELWTNDVLSAARRIYRRAGFERTRAESHRSFGRDLVGETWELPL